MSHMPKSGNSRYLGVSSSHDGLLSPSDNLESGNSSNFIIAPGPGNDRNGSNNLGGKVSPKTKIHNYSYLSKKQSPPKENRANATFNQDYRMEKFEGGNSNRKIQNDFTMDYERENDTNGHLAVPGQPKNLKRAKSTKRVGRIVKPLEQKTNLYTSNGFSLAYLSPSKNQNSSIYKIEQTFNALSKYDDRRSFDPRKASTPKQTPSISSVYENKKKLNDYHRTIKGDKSTKIDSKRSEASSMTSSKAGKVNDYPYHGIRRMENFSQKLHSVANSSGSKRVQQVQKDTKTISTNDHIRESLNMDSDQIYQSMGE